MELTDLHCHILPGIDDGPKDIGESLDLARACLNTGITRVAVTSHVNQRHQNRPEGIRERRTELREALAGAGLDLTLEMGAEVTASWAGTLSDSDLDGLRLGGGEWLLVEPPTRATTAETAGWVSGIQKRGFRVLLAHPERNSGIQNNVGALIRLVESGVRTQITAEALTGRYGAKTKGFAGELFRRGLVHTVASDAHHAVNRPPGLEKALASAGYGELTDWLCRQMPGWILDGGEEPDRPAVVSAGSVS